MSNLLDMAATWVADSTLSPTTLAKYAYSFGKFASWGIRETSDVTRERVTTFMSDQRAHGASASTCNRDLSALTSLAKWLWKRGLFDLDLWKELQRCYYPVPPRPTPRFLSPTEYRRLRAFSTGGS